MVAKYISSFGQFTRFRVDDDFVDKLNYRITTFIIALFAIIVSIKQFIGKPIECWVPANFFSSWQQYAENECLMSNTYYLPFNSMLPTWETRRGREISYYKWVPLVLILQALYFYMPSLIWRLLNWQTGINIQSLVQMGCDYKLHDSEARQKAINLIVAQTEKALHQRPFNISRVKLPLKNTICATLRGVIVTCIYLLVKFLFMSNIIGQYSWINNMLSGANFTSGFNPINDALHGREPSFDGIFPSNIMCDFEIRNLGTTHHYTLQCVLPINALNEMIFLSLWVWFSLLWFITIGNFFYWVFVSVIPNRRAAFVSKYLVGMEGYRNVDNHSLRRFVTSYLRHDGVFLLRMMANHTDELFCSDLTKTLWSNYCNHRDLLYEA